MEVTTVETSDLYLLIMHVIVITQEKTIQNIEGFDKTKLKHADTAEKVVLPDEQGNTAWPPDIVCRKALMSAADLFL